MMTLTFISSAPYTFQFYISHTVTGHITDTLHTAWHTLFTGRVTNASTVNADCITSINLGNDIADKALKLHKIRP